MENKIEFGSDFHSCNYPIGNSLLNIYKNVNLYIDGRQAFIDIVRNNNWQCVWMPSYYCYGFIEAVMPYVQVKLYDYTPFDDLYITIQSIKVSRNDAIVIPNYFGLSSGKYGFLDCAVIEDHTHDLISDWAKASTADWCFASLRKTLPISDGGILWSPKQLRLPPTPKHTVEGEMLAEDRTLAMHLKAKYLNGENISKDSFRELYIKTEREFDNLPISSISHQSQQIVSSLDVVRWYNMKRRNWFYATNNIISGDKVCPIGLDHYSEYGYPFSIVLKCSSENIRTTVKMELIRNNVYPAVLWDISAKEYTRSRTFGKNMLSIHCDGRYSIEQIKYMVDIINDIITRCLK